MSSETEATQSVRADAAQRMLDAGVHIGHQRSKGHPKMKPYIFTTRQSIQIINVEKTLEKLEEAKAFLRDLAAKGGVILFVATKVPGRLMVRAAAEKVGMPFVEERWLGGTLSNFPVLLKRLEYFIGQELKRKQGELEKYPKKEQVLLVREIESLEKKMGGLKQLKKLPDALLVIDIAEHLAALREARAANIPVVAVSDTNSDPTLATHPVPANDRSAMSVDLVLNELTAAVKEGLAKKGEAPVPQE